MNMTGTGRLTLFKCLALTGAVLVLCGFTTTTLDPDRAEIVTSDVEHFWQAFDDAAKLPLAERAAIYQKEYFDRGSQGFKDFIAFRKLTPENLAQHVEEQRAYYEKIRPYIKQVVDQKPVIQAAFRRLKALYPDAKFPAHVYFVVGKQRGAGMNSDNGIILAAEMFASPPGTPYAYNIVYPDFVPFAAVHETVHFNQVYQIDDKSDVLQASVSEGSADFIASLVVAEPVARQYTDRWDYGCVHEAAMAARLTEDADKTDMGPWLYNHTPDTGWPPDMGYWIGYRIDQAYYAQAKDKAAALRAILQVTDFDAFLKASDYPEEKTACTPEKPVQQ